MSNTISFGTPYIGSKNRIAARIVSSMPEAARFVDLFAGGCAVSHAAMLSGKFQAVHMNDLDCGGVSLFVRCLREPVTVSWVSRAEFFARKDTDALVRWVWSFGMDGRTYCFGREREKSARDAWQSGNMRDPVLHDLPRRIMRLREIHKTARLVRCRYTTSAKDFRAVPVRAGDVVYLDPPYDRAVGYGPSSKVQDSAYDVWAFARKLARVARAVYVSEYCDNAPVDFKLVRLFNIHHNTSHKDTNRAEGLFTPCASSRDFV